MFEFCENPMIFQISGYQDFAFFARAPTRPFARPLANKCWFWPYVDASRPTEQNRTVFQAFVEIEGSQNGSLMTWVAWIPPRRHLRKYFQELNLSES